MRKIRWIPAAVFTAAALLSIRVPAEEQAAVRENIQYTDKDGMPVTEQFQLIGGKQVYLGADGTMVTDALIEDRGEYYYMDADGMMLKNGWKKLEDPGDGEMYWYYFGTNGKAKQEGWLMLNGKKYHFTSAHMDTGWYSEPDESGTSGDPDSGETAVNTYYLGGEDDGAAESGWLPYKGTDENAPEKEVGWYYFSPSTHKMVSAGEKQIGNNWYAFDANGMMVDGFATVRNPEPEGLTDRYLRKYYDPVSGARADGWRYVDDSDETAEDGTSQEGWYYFRNGKAYTAWDHTELISRTVGVAKINGEYYAFDTQGRMKTGLVLSENDDEKYNARYYYFGPEGQMKTGRVNVADSELNGPSDEMYFEPRFSSVPEHGMSVTGEAGGRLYDNGVPVLSERDRYALVTLSDGKTYVVSENGTLKKSGTVTLDSGVKMKISFDGENYSWEKAE